jgi:hypothetical protein
MKTTRYVALFLAALSLAVLAAVAGADEKVNGRVKSINLETRTVIVSSYTGQEVTISLSAEDTRTLAKLKNRQIAVDDDIRVKYLRKDGKNTATSIKTHALCGC